MQDAVIDVGKLAAGQFPIDSLGGGGIAVGGNLFGGKVSGSLFLADEVVGGKTVFYGGIEAGLDIEGLAGFEIRLGISQYGPLDAFVEVNAPIILDPDSGLAVTDLYGEVLFDDPLTPISQPITSAGRAAEQRRVHQARQPDAPAMGRSARPAGHEPGVQQRTLGTPSASRSRSRPGRRSSTPTRPPTPSS